MKFVLLVTMFVPAFVGVVPGMLDLTTTTPVAKSCHVHVSRRVAVAVSAHVYVSVPLPLARLPELPDEAGAASPAPAPSGRPIGKPARELQDMQINPTL